MINVLLRTLLSLVILPPCAVVAQTNAYAYGYFYAPDGSLALVNIVRTQDATTRVVTTELYYSFCGQANLGTACQQGDGVIPNGNTSGGVYTNVNSPDVFSVNVDTSTEVGTVLGVAAVGDATMVTSSSSQTLLEKFQARKALKK